MVHPGTYAESPTIAAANVTLNSVNNINSNTNITGTLTIATGATNCRVNAMGISTTTVSGTAGVNFSNCSLGTFTHSSRTYEWNWTL
jgi:hypothetical protein